MEQLPRWVAVEPGRESLYLIQTCMYLIQSFMYCVCIMYVSCKYKYMIHANTSDCIVYVLPKNTYIIQTTWFTDGPVPPRRPAHRGTAPKRCSGAACRPAAGRPTGRAAAPGCSTRASVADAAALPLPSLPPALLAYCRPQTSSLECIIYIP